MNRNEEYMQMLGQLDTLKAPENTVKRSVRRYKVNKYLVRPLAGIAVVFAAFTVLVNVSMKVAFAASRVPVLRDLASAVTFSRSLKDAVSNGYAQLVDIKQSDENVSVSVEYLIVDQKTVTVFYRAKSDKYEELLVSPLFSTTDGKAFSSTVTGSSNAVSGDGRQLYFASLELLGEGDMPSTVLMKLSFYAPEADITQMPKSVSDLEFELSFDPEFTSRGKHIELGQSVRLGDQTVIIKSVDIYPSYMTVATESTPENSAWLRSLDLYVLSDKGERFDVPEGASVRSYSSNTGYEISNYRLDSPYFYNAKDLKLFISSAGWLEKGKEHIEVDLAGRSANGLPEGVTLADVSRTDVNGKDAWLVTLRVPEARKSDYSGGVAEPCEGGYYTVFWQMWRSDHNGKEAPAGYCYIDCLIEDCPYDTVKLPVNISYTWQAETQLEITIDLRSAD